MTNLTQAGMTNGLCEHASTAIFLQAQAEIKNLLCEQLRQYNSQAASTSYIFRLQQSIWKSFFFKQNRKHYKMGFLKQWQNFCGRPPWCSILRDYFGNKNDPGGFKTNSTWNKSCTLRLREEGKCESLGDTSHRAFQLKQEQPLLEES